METLLTDIIDDASLAQAREAVRTLAVEKGLIDRAVLVVSELGRNQLRHARNGSIAVRVIERGSSRGIELVAKDEGAGIADFAAALDATPRESGSLGVGIGSIKRLSSELDVDVRLGEGSIITARLFASGAPRRREVGVYGRPIASERRSGDHAAFVRDGDALVLAVCDGLGHGPPARAAADAAMDVFFARSAADPAVILEECHRSLGATRGVVMAIARIREEDGALTIASAGNIDVQTTAFRRPRRFGGSSAVVGGRPGPIKVRTEVVPLVAEDVVVLTTDGITSKAAIDDDAALLRAHPAVIAQRIFERFARANDDALVLVAR